MRRWVKRGLLALVVCTLAVPALAFFQWTDMLGNRFTGTVLLWLSGGYPTAVSASAPLPVTGIATFNYTTSNSATVATSSGVLATAGQYKLLKVCTLPTSTANVWLNLAGGTAVPGAGLPIMGGGACRTIGTEETPMPTSTPITAITDGAAAQPLSQSGG